MEKASDQQAKMITPQKARQKVPNQRIFINKSGSNRTEKYTNGNNQTDAFPLSGMGYSGGFPFHCVHKTRVVENPLVPYDYRGSKRSALAGSVKHTYESAGALQ